MAFDGHLMVVGTAQALLSVPQAIHSLSELLRKRPPENDAAILKLTEIRDSLVSLDEMTAWFDSRDSPPW